MHRRFGNERHIDGFTDPLADCKGCKTLARGSFVGERALSRIFAAIGKQDVVCPDCGELTDIRKFNLMFKTEMGVIEDSTSTIYLRPETRQGIYVNF